MSDGFIVDDARAPIIFVRYPKEVTLEAYQRLFDEYVALCEKHDRVAWLIDMRDFDAHNVSPTLRRQAADVFAHARDKLIHVSVCEARVVSTAELRGVLTAFDWLTGSKWPCKSFGTMEAAEAWIAEQLSLSTPRQ